MIYDLSKALDKEQFKIKSDYYLNNGSLIDLTKKSKGRTAAQNSALHLFFTMVSDQLNELGMDFTYNGLNIAKVSLKHTPHIVKEFIWRPIQIAMFEIESTTKLDTKQMNDIIDVIVNFFANMGVVMEFPCIDTLIEQIKNK